MPQVIVHSVASSRRRSGRLCIPLAVGDDEPLRLEVAAVCAFPDGSMTASEQSGEKPLVEGLFERIAGKDYTTLAAIRDMRMLCLNEAKARVSGSSRNSHELATWVILAGRQAQAAHWLPRGSSSRGSRALADYIRAESKAPRRRERNSAQVKVADVISIYAVDVAGRHARPARQPHGFGRLLEFFGDRTLAHVSRANLQCVCRCAAKTRSGAARAGRPSRGYPTSLGPRACVRPSRP